MLHYNIRPTAYGLPLSYKTMLKRLSRGTHSSLFVDSVSDDEKESLARLGPR